MKKIIALLVFVSLVRPAIADNHKAEFTPEYRVRYSLSDGDGGSADAWVHRMKIGAEFKTNDSVTFNTTLVYSDVFGEDSLNAALSGANTQTPTPDTEAGIVVNEAFLTWQVNENTTFKLGRSSMEIADGSSVAVNDFQDYLTAMDGGVLTWEQDFGRISVFGVRFADLDQVSTLDNSNAAVAAANLDGVSEADAVGVSFELKVLPEWLSSLNLHVNQVDKDQVDKDDNKVITVDQKYFRAGLTVEGNASLIDYRATYIYASGDSGSASLAQSMYDAEIGAQFEELMNLRVFVGYHSDTGGLASDFQAQAQGEARDSEQYEPFYYDIHKNAGKMDILRWGNLTYLKAGFTLDLADDLNLGVTYHMFSATEADGYLQVQRLASNPLHPRGFVFLKDGDDDLGAELDVELSKTYSNGLTAAAAYRTFSMGSAFGEAADDLSQYWLELKYNF